MARVDRLDRTERNARAMGAVGSQIYGSGWSASSDWGEVARTDTDDGMDLGRRVNGEWLRLIR